MRTHRRNWGWWLVLAIAVAVAASLLYRRSATAPDGSGAAAVDSSAAASVVRDTLYVEIGGETVPLVTEHKAEPAGIRPGKVPGSGPGEADAPAPGSGEAAAPASAETVIAIPVSDITSIIRSKSGQDITVSTQAPDRILLTYAGEVDVPMLGEQTLHFTAGFRIIEVQGDRLVLQIDSGVAKNAAADLFAPHILERLPAGLVDSYANGRAVINLSAVPALKKRLKSLDIVGFSLDEEAIRLRTVEK